MNHITCGIAEDLLPLYIDGCCSEDSQQALEEHMKTCEKCKDKYVHLRRDLPPFAAETIEVRSDAIAISLSKKIRKRKLCIAVIAAILVLFVVTFLFFAGKAMIILSKQNSIVSLDNLGNTVNLSEDDFSCSAKDIGEYNFYTNTTRIIVKSDASLDDVMTVRLWNIEDKSGNIMLSYLDNKQKTCIFTHLPSQNYYSITIDNMPDISITVSSRLTFWEALSYVLQNM